MDVKVLFNLQMRVKKRKGMMIGQVRDGKVVAEHEENGIKYQKGYKNGGKK
jgi:hypothetical protein